MTEAAWLRPVTIGHDRALCPVVVGTLDARSRRCLGYAVPRRLGWMLVISSLIASCGRPGPAPTDAGARPPADRATGEGNEPLEASLLCSSIDLEQRSELRRRVACSQAGHAAYCDALDAFAKGAPAEPPIGPLAGRSLTVARSEFHEAAAAVLGNRLSEVTYLRSFLEKALRLGSNVIYE